VPLVLIFAIVLLQLLDVAVVKSPRERLDGMLFDLKVKRLPSWPINVTNIQIVDIDEFSLSQIGRMPWPRDVFAQLTRKLSELGAIVISYDVLFSEPQKNPALTVLSQLDSPLSKALSDNPDFLSQFDYDQQFANAVGQSEVIFSVLLHVDSDTKTEQPLRIGQINSEGVVQSTPNLPSLLQSYPAYAGLLTQLADVSAGMGFMNAFQDPDGFIRRSALLAEVDGKLYPSLALETFRVYSLIDKVLPIWQTSEKVAYLTGIEIGNTFVATDNMANIFIPYRGKAKTFPYTSASEVINDNVTDQRFEQAVVFIGTSANGLADLRATPVGLGFPGVEIQATLFDALIAPQYIPYQPEWWREALLVQIILIGIICLLFFPNRSPVVTTSLTLIFLSMVIGVNLLLWYQYFIYLPLVSPILLTILMSGFYVSRGFFTESVKRKEVNAVFAQYVPHAHIERILKDPDSVNLSGEKKELSVMFSDIRGFTSISETMSAGELKLWLNQFFSPVTQAILQHDGTIDKYVGDMVMAFWGAPLDEPNHASRSIDAAFAMLQELTELNKTFVNDNKPQALIGIGINTGEMNVGDMGSDFRRSYTVIGDAVNLGARLEGLTKFYGVEILVSEFTRQQALEYEYCLVDKVKVKGKAVPVTIYSPLSHSASDDEIREKNEFNLCVELYFAQHFQAALELILLLSATMKNQHLLELYKQRIEQFLFQPPPTEWDGSFTHINK
jgi:adenylate cyclase